MKRFVTAFLMAFLVLSAGEGLMSKTSQLAKFEIAKGIFKKGMSHFNNMEYLAAAEYFRKAVNEYPEYYSARDYLARSYELAGFIDAAASELSIISKMFPEDAAAASRAEAIAFRDSFRIYEPALEGLVLRDVVMPPERGNMSFPDPVDIAVDGNKSLYITSFSSGRMVKTDSQGHSLFSVTPSADGKLYGIDCSGKLIAVTDFKNDKIFIYDSEGSVQTSMGGTGSGPGKFHGPQGICFGENGCIYAVDSGNSRIEKFSADGRFILQFGKKGIYDGELMNPSDIAYLDGHLYITDSGNSRICVFDTFGNFCRTLKYSSDCLSGIQVRGGRLFISDKKKGLVEYSIDDGSISTFNSWTVKDGSRKDSFGTLMTAAFDRDGYLYCLDAGRGCVLVFSPAARQYSNLNTDITAVDTDQFPAVAFYVNVRDRMGRPVTGLTPEHFTLTEDSAEMRLESVDYIRKRTPAAASVICVDRSESCRKNAAEIPWLADFFLKKMHTDDSVKILDFNSDSMDSSDFDWSRRRNLKVLKSGEFGRGRNTGKALYNAITDLVPKLERRAVILITDGTLDPESFSQYSERTVISYAKSHFIPVYIISTGTPDPSLINIAQSTGGDVFRPGEADRMGMLYSRIKDSEEYRYVLVYSTFKRSFFKGWWSDVKIDVDYRGMKGTQWGGYFVPGK